MKQFKCVNSIVTPFCSVIVNLPVSYNKQCNCNNETSSTQSDNAKNHPRWWHIVVNAGALVFRKIHCADAETNFEYVKTRKGEN